MLTGSGTTASSPGSSATLALRYNAICAPEVTTTRSGATGRPSQRACRAATASRRARSPPLGAYVSPPRCNAPHVAATAAAGGRAEASTP